MKKSFFLTCVFSFLFIISCKGSYKENVNKDKYQEVVNYIQKGDVDSIESSINSLNIDTIIIDQNTDTKYSLLGYACKYKKYDIVKLLLKHGADINVGESDDIYEYDALYIAINNNDEYLLTLLLNNGSDPNNIYTEYGLTPLGLSSRLGLYGISKILLNHGAKINGVDLSDEDYQTYPIIEAVLSRNKELINLLIDNHVSLNVTDKQGNSPLSIAQSKNDSIIINILSKANSTIEKSSWCINDNTVLEISSIKILQFKFLDYSLNTTLDASYNLFFRYPIIRPIPESMMDCRDYSENEPIGKIELLGDNTIKFNWYGFYNTKTKERVHTQNPFGGNDDFSILKKCINN